MNAKETLKQMAQGKKEYWTDPETGKKIDLSEFDDRHSWTPPKKKGK